MYSVAYVILVRHTALHASAGRLKFVAGYDHQRPKTDDVLLVSRPLSVVEHESKTNFRKAILGKFALAVGKR